MEHTLLQKLLSRIEKASIPNNPRNIKKEKKQHNYFFVSTKIREIAVSGVVRQIIVGKTYRKE